MTDYRNSKLIARYEDVVFEPETALKTGKVQNMDPWSMDPLRGPGPWTGSIKIWTGSMDPLSWTGSMDPLIMDRVHGPPIFTS